MPSEAAVVKQVRPVVVERDGYCRVAQNRTLGFLGACAGVSEWAHIGEHRRCFTRKMEPEVRHTSAGTAMFCSGHHHAYDGHVFTVEPLTERGCDGPVAFVRGEQRFEEQS
jgi:hypothetical protein